MRRTKIAFTVVGMAALFAAPVSAQSAYLWEEFGAGSGQTLSYNPLTVQTANGVVTVLEKVAYDTPLPIGNGVSAAWSTVRMQINCAASTFQHLAFTMYDTNGDTVNYPDPLPAGSHPIIQGSGSGAALLQAKLCT